MLHGLPPGGLTGGGGFSCVLGLGLPGFVGFVGFVFAIDNTIY
jgi:hypothetical protein